MQCISVESNFGTVRPDPTPFNSNKYSENFSSSFAMHFILLRNYNFHIRGIPHENCYHRFGDAPKIGFNDASPTTNIRRKKRRKKNELLSVWYFKTLYRNCRIQRIWKRNCTNAWRARVLDTVFREIREVWKGIQKHPGSQPMEAFQQLQTHTQQTTLFRLGITKNRRWTWKTLNNCIVFLIWKICLKTWLILQFILGLETIKISSY